MSQQARTRIAAGLVGAGVLWFALALSIAGVVYPRGAAPASGGSIPAAVLARSEVARSHMKQIADALFRYAVENSGDLPTDLTTLYPTYISDPRVFWHPGDSDPQPTTIDNQNPNQPNSLRISFAYTSAQSLDDLGDSDPLIWDNATSNNAGLFINKMTYSGLRTEPPFITPTPTRQEVALYNLKSLATSLLTYASANKQNFPIDLITLAEWESPSTFWNPGDSDPEPTAITNSVPNAVNSTQISFAYLGGNAGTSERKIVLLDNSLANNEGAGVHIVTSDGSTAFFETSSRFLPLTITARANLQQLGNALRVYAADNLDRFPPKLSKLYPNYVSNPAVFWNPGDRNPQPTTISTDTPDTINSAQISFSYLGDGYNLDSDAGVVLIVDNSLSNNGGTGANILFADGHVGYYAPATPSCQDPLACITIAKANLAHIGMGLLTYAADNRDYLPSTLSMLYPDSIPNPTTFWNPGDSNPSPLTIDNDVPDQDDSAQISFEYVTPGSRLDFLEPDDILVRDNSLANNAGRGISVLYAAGYVGFIPSVTLSSITIDSGPAVVPAAGFGNYTCTATYSDSSTLDVTKYATWSVTSGPGGVSSQGTYAAPLWLPTDSAATIHVSYKENGITRTADKVITVEVCHNPFADTDGDGDVDQDDFGAFQRCLGAAGPLSELCSCFDRPEPPSYPSGDGDVDQADLQKFVGCTSGPGIPADPDCDD